MWLKAGINLLPSARTESTFGMLSPRIKWVFDNWTRIGDLGEFVGKLNDIDIQAANCFEV
jgi:hypothetical protein